MKYFTKAKTIEEAKSLYKKLAMANHPDISLSPEATKIMQEINEEFDMVFKFLKRSYPETSKASTNSDTSTSYRSEFYTQNGWKGEKYDSSLHGKDIAKLLREYVKFVYPLWKFSITSDYNSIDVHVMEGPFFIYVPMEEAKQKIRSSGKLSNYYNNDEAYMLECLTRDYDSPISQVNHYHIDEDYMLTDFAKLMFKDIDSFLVDYTRDDSDAMIDYFNCNLYRNLSVGKWDKPFTVVEKTLRITPTKEAGAKRLTK